MHTNQVHFLLWSFRPVTWLLPGLASFSQADGVILINSVFRYPVRRKMPKWTAPWPPFSFASLFLLGPSILPNHSHLTNHFPLSWSPILCRVPLILLPQCLKQGQWHIWGSCSLVGAQGLFPLSSPRKKACSFFSHSNATFFSSAQGLWLVPLLNPFAKNNRLSHRSLRLLHAQLLAPWTGSDSFFFFFQMCISHQ